MQNDEQLERLLLKAPAPPTPFGLEQRLIHQAGRARPRQKPAWTWFSLFPRENGAAAAALLTVAAAVLTALAYQQNTLSGLKRAEKELAAAIGGTPPETKIEPRGQHDALLSAELQLLRKESAELQALRAEMSEIQRLLAAGRDAADQNAALRAELSKVTQNRPEDSPELEAMLSAARDKARRIQCVNNLKNIGLAARIWAKENGDKNLPGEFAIMTHQVASPKILVCPSDPARAEAHDDPTLEQLAATGGSYEILSPGIAQEHWSAAYVRCRFHPNVTLVDGSVFQLRPEQQLVQRNGNWEISE